MSRTQKNAKGEAVRVDDEKHGCLTINTAKEAKASKATPKASDKGDKA